MSPTVLAALVIEHDPVRRWREQQLERAGYPPLDALVLSGRSDIDLHGAMKLLQHGCPLRTALQILICSP